MKFIYFLAVIFLLVSCNKEEEGVAAKSDSNYLQNNIFQNNTAINAYYYNNAMYRFAEARVLNNSYSDNDFEKALLLYSKGFIFSEDGELIEANGSYVYVLLKTNTYNNIIPNGKYVYNSSNNLSKYTFNYSEFDTNFNNNSNTESHYINDGYFEISNSGNNYYTITFNCTDENGNNIYGNYSGIVIFD